MHGGFTIPSVSFKFKIIVSSIKISLVRFSEGNLVSFFVLSSFESSSVFGESSVSLVKSGLRINNESIKSKDRISFVIMSVSEGGLKIT